ncbi:MAG: Abortive infection protein [Microbacterium sp. SCN 70-200]|uniref:CPBP family intramembrane glutamic endopeptidase n=1 Tax=unclassified Microbacterium TaxID=2609290 RepID=UPI00086E6191|nr:MULTISPECIES: CPBP family intramembrane glutamic endopeptidase [unclassified Microbacterium]MBN9213544.1 CPBP family intramembrane metalloprotease [Microbacterium sp.]ODT41639.1 MAG: Abortive infection protein [Microbacterium sp. SCN 70-200]OJV85170.1 MAG: CAAX protease family protein [Microbacterium sp. 70-16]
MTLPPDAAIAPVLPPAPRPLPADATAGGLAFHRLVFARRRSGWWTPLAVAGLGLVFYVAMLAVVTALMVVVALADPSFLERTLALAENPTIDVADPVMLVFLLGTIILMLPSYVLASLIVNGKRTGLISSAAGRLRWRWMLLCGLIALVLSAVLTGLSLLIPGDEAPAAEPNAWWAVSLVLVILLVPLQSAAEEYIFRGFLMQAIGRWLRHPAFAILVPVPLFVLGHMYDLLGQISVGLFAVAAGWLTWRTGGLEAAIALHVVNNLTGFIVGIAAGTNPTESTTGWVSFLWSFVLVGGYVALIEWRLARKPLARTLVLTPPAPAPYAALSPSASNIV